MFGSNVHVPAALVRDMRNGCAQQLPSTVVYASESTKANPGSYTHLQGVGTRHGTTGNALPGKVRYIELQTTNASATTRSVVNLTSAIRAVYTGQAFLLDAGIAVYTTAAHITTAAPEPGPINGEPYLRNLEACALIDSYYVNNCIRVGSRNGLTAGHRLALQVLEAGRAGHAPDVEDWLNSAGFFDITTRDNRAASLLWQKNVFHIGLLGPMFTWKRGMVDVESLGHVPLNVDLTPLPASGVRTLGWGTGAYATMAPITGFTPKTVSEIKLYAKIWVPDVDLSEIPASLHPKNAFQAGTMVLPYELGDIVVQWAPSTAPTANEAKVQFAEDYYLDAMTAVFTWQTVDQAGQPVNGPFVSTNEGRDQNPFYISPNGFPLYTTGGAAFLQFGAPVHLKIAAGTRLLYSTVATHRLSTRPHGAGPLAIAEHMTNFLAVAASETLPGSRDESGHEHEVQVASSGFTTFTAELNYQAAVGGDLVAGSLFQLAMPPTGRMQSIVLRYVTGIVHKDENGNLVFDLVKAAKE